MRRFKNIAVITFSSYDVERRTRNAKFYHQINILVDWKKIDKIIEKHCHKGETLTGENPYSGLLIFKMLLVCIWNNLSDVKLEEHVNDSLSAMKFCGLQLEDTVPDHSTISRFRTLLSEVKAWDQLLNSINSELEKHNLILKQGVKVDASPPIAPFVQKADPLLKFPRIEKKTKFPTSKRNCKKSH